MPRLTTKFPRIRRGLRSWLEQGRPTVNLLEMGCVHRKVYQIAVMPDKRFGRRWEGQIIEQLGSFDPIPNQFGEKICAINYDRLKYWIARDCTISKAVLELLGLSGFFPVHPLSYIRAKKQRYISEKIAELIKTLPGSVSPPK